MLHRTRSRRGVSLIEVMIVTVYIALLASIVLPHLTGANKRAREVSVKATLSELRKAVASFHAETGLYPAQLPDIVSRTPPAFGLTATGQQVTILPADFRGPYLFARGGGLPKDELTGLPDWRYTTSVPNIGAVHTSAIGNSIDMGPYSLF
jgi:prepilin-type N-terminal cleavage/methylation domain-containing protein